MVIIKKIIKYLICVLISMVGLSIFGFIFSGGKSIFMGDFVFTAPVYFSLGWGIYQIHTNKLTRDSADYNWMLIKISFQSGIILIVGLFLVLWGMGAL